MGEVVVEGWCSPARISGRGMRFAWEKWWSRDAVRMVELVVGGCCSHERSGGRGMV